MKLYKYKNLHVLDVEKKCKELFIENYIKDVNGNRIVINTTNNERVIFHEYNYDHAFSHKNKNYDKYNLNTKKRLFSYQRARRLFWIKETVTGNNNNAVRKDIKQDVYFYDPKEKYVIIFKKLKSGDLQFITHYCVKNEISLKNIEKKVLY